MSELWTFFTGEKMLPVIISAITTIIVFFLTLLTKNYIDTKLLSSKLEIEHKFDQRRQIKEVLAKYKIHLMMAAEDLNHRMHNFSHNYNGNWLQVNGNFKDSENYYFQSFIYRFISFFAWSKKIQKEMIFLDTTIATKEDLEFIKFLQLFPRCFCDYDLTLLDRKKDDNFAQDHFYRNTFDLFSNCLLSEQGIKSYDEYITALPSLQDNLHELFEYLDGMTPNEKRKRWDRFYFFHLTLILFLNNYGYDFQYTNDKNILKTATKPRKSDYLKNYFNRIKKYKLENNKEVKRIMNKLLSHFSQHP